MRVKGGNNLHETYTRVSLTEQNLHGAIKLEDDMTIKQIAEKYELKYFVVYDATVGVKPVASIWRDKDFIEEEVMRNVKANLEAKIRKAEKTAEAARETLKKINERGAERNG